MKKILKNNATLIALLVIIMFFTYRVDKFFTSRNLSNLTLQVTVIGIIAVGMTLVILLGGIDLSVGSIVGLSAVVVTLFMQKGINMVFAIILTIIVCGLLTGFWNGFLIAKYKIPAFIITLGMMTITRGLALTISKGSSIPVKDPRFQLLGGEYIGKGWSAIILLVILIAGILSVIAGYIKKKKYKIETSPLELIMKLVLIFIGMTFTFWVYVNYRGIPYPVATFGIIIMIFVFILRKTRYGRNIYAVGGNEEAARLSGINVFFINLTVYTIISALASLSGILLASRLNGASPNLGNMFELDAISAVIIGGTSTTGGSGTIVGTIIGTLIIGTLNNGMSLLGVDTSYQFIIKGFIIILAVWFDVVNKKKKV